MFLRIKPAFSIRFVLVLVLVIALALGVTIVPYRQYRRQMAVAREIVAFREIIGDFDGPPTLETRPCWQARLIGDERTGLVTALRFTEPVSAERIARIAEFGDLETLCLYGGIEATAAHLVPLAGHSSLRKLNLEGPGFKDEDLALLKTFPRLESLVLGADDITDAGLVLLIGLDRLESLGILGSKIEGRELDALARLPRLRELELSYNNELKDEGLDHLRPATQLRTLRLNLVNNGQITEAGLERLKSMTHLEELYVEIEMTREFQDALVQSLRKALPKTKVIVE